ncbi:histone H2A.v2 [Arabidopsis lyrata subsp. lyrata]|uniref:histone H2A.v2 n=1 Tax=Arabidopsis lyrata subsp. lyrata TaxID=81972 RepID=UPI000A29A816|nr:histone H2A.v2 [Arabidopsis lyrata subsp. lyrata]|eukprot:XP_020887795.1 histone H2A.v2 [Arabidopsis lyrata subsp. lyrata]
MRKSKVPKSTSANLEQAYRSLISASRGLSRTLSPSLPESQPPPPQLESQSPSTVVSSFPAPVTPSPPSQEEIQTRSRNREEIRRVIQSQDEGTYNKKKTKQDEASLKSEEDLELKQNLELYVERVQDPNPELQKAALESMRLSRDWDGIARVVFHHVYEAYPPADVQDIAPTQVTLLLIEISSARGRR